MPSICPGNKDIFRELRVRFVIFPRIIISESFFVCNNFVSEGKFPQKPGSPKITIPKSHSNPIGLPTPENYSRTWNREEKSVHNHHRKTIIWRTCWPQRKTFQTGGGYENPIKTRKPYPLPKSFLCGPHFSAKKSSALEQGGVCFLFPSGRVNTQIPDTLILERTLPCTECGSRIQCIQMF